MSKQPSFEDLKKSVRNGTYKTNTQAKNTENSNSSSSKTTSSAKKTSNSNSPSFDDIKTNVRNSYNKKADRYTYITKQTDFDHYTKQGSEYENPDFEEVNTGIRLFGWNPFADKIKNKVTYSRNNADKVQMGNQNDGKLKYTYMTDQEVNIYNYLLAKNGADEAEKYLDDIDDSLNQRQGAAEGNRVTNPVAQGLYSLYAGVDQFNQGTKQLFTKDAVKPSITQYASNQIANNIDNKAGKTMYEVGRSVGNMLPSIGVSALSGGLGLGAKAASLLGVGTIGASAGGNTYSQAIADGYSEKEARNYGIASGIKEAATEYLLGGINKLSGGLGKKLSSAAVSKIGTVINKLTSNPTVINALQSAGKIGANALSEGTEEYVGGILDPLLKNLTLDENNEIDLLSEDALHSALLGAITGGVFSTAGVTGENVNNYNTGKVFYNTNTMQDVVNEGLQSNPTTKSYQNAVKLQDRINKGQKVGNIELGQQYNANVEAINEEEAALQQQENKTDPEQGIESKGKNLLSPESVKTERTPLDIANEMYNVNAETEKSNLNLTPLQTTKRSDLTKQTVINNQTDKSMPNIQNNTETSNTEATEAITKAAATYLNSDTKITVKGINQITEDGKVIVTSNDGANDSVSNLDDINFENLSTASVYAKAAKYNTLGAKAYVNGYQSDIDVDTYTKGFDTFYNLGKTEFPKEKINTYYAAILPQQAQEDAYNAGLAYANENVARRQKIANKQKLPSYSNVKSGVIKNEISDGMDPTEKSVLHVLGRHFNIPIVMDEDIEGANGYIANGTIHISAKSDDKPLIVFSHEITHNLEKKSPIMHKKYRDYVINYMKTEHTEEYNQLVEHKKNLYQRNGIELNEDSVMNEIAANATEVFLTDPEAIEKLTKQDKTLAEKILEIINALLDDIKSMFKAYSATSKEGKMLRENKTVLEQARKLWLQALEDVNNITNTAENVFHINEDAENMDLKEEISDTFTKYSLREENPPKKTLMGYKVFYAKDGKLYPPMVANTGGVDTPIGVWLNADVGTVSEEKTKTGRTQVLAGGKGTARGKQTLAFRPGWHLGEIPKATQFLKRSTGEFPKDFVWAECEIAADIDYQEEAMSYGITASGKFQHSLAGLPKLPADGYYKYRTNPNPDTVPWLITGAMKVNKILNDDEVNAILKEHGEEPVPREGGNINLEKLGLSQYANVRFSLKENEESKNLNKITDKGLTMTYVRNSEKAPYFGDTYGQNIEPSGEYMSMDTMKGKHKIPGWEYGTIAFKNPLVLDWVSTGNNGWKRTLSEKYNGLTKKKLSNAIMKDGYDAIVTVDKDGSFNEIVNLKGNKIGSNLQFSLKEFEIEKEEITLPKITTNAFEDIDLWEKQHKERDAAIQNVFENSRAVLMENGKKHNIIFHKSVKDGVYQLSYLYDGIPTMDIQKDTIEEAVQEIGKSVRILKTIPKDAKVFSLKDDSEGNTLTNEQQEFFKDSKVRDENGKLLVMYHGTGPNNFTVFDNTSHAHYRSEGLSGLWFTDNFENAKNYVYGTTELDENGQFVRDKKGKVKVQKGKIMKVYLNATNPLIIDYNDVESVKSVIFPKNTIYSMTPDLWKYYENQTDSMTKYFHGRKLQEIISKGVKNVMNKAKNDGTPYDAVIMKNFSDPELSTQIVVFDSNQIKNVDNQKPTSDPDIRYSIKEVSEEDRKRLDKESYYDMQQEHRILEKKLKEYQKSPELKEWIEKIHNANETNIGEILEQYKQFEDRQNISGITERIKQLKMDMEIKDRLFEEADEAEVAKKIQESKLSEEDYHRQEAIKEFGYTPYFYDAGYLLPNGKLLNFSGEKGKHFGSRGEDHRAISTVIKSKSGGGSDSMVQFMSEGNIRVMAETPGIDLINTVEPTKEQYATIKKFILNSANREYFTIDFTNKDGYSVDNLEYENRLKPDKIINDIKYYYEHGEKPYVSEIDSFRFSLKDTSDVDIKQTTESSEKVGEAIDLLKKQLNITKGYVPSVDEISKMARKILKDYNSSYDYFTLTDNLSTLFAYIANTETKMYDDAIHATNGMAKKIIEKSRSIDKGLDEQYKELKFYLRSTKIKLSDKAKEEIANEYDTYEIFRKKYFNKIRFANDGTNLDSLWGELSGKYPELFPQDTPDTEQPKLLAQAIEITEPHLDNEFGMVTDEQAQDLALNIFNEYFKQPALTVNNVAALRKQFTDKLKEIELSYKQEYSEKLIKLQDHSNERLARQKAKYNKRVEEYKYNKHEREEIKIYKDRIEKNAYDLTTWLTNPTDDKHVPEILKRTVTNFLSSLDLRSNRLNIYGDSTSKTLRWDAAMDQLRLILGEAESGDLKEGDTGGTFNDFYMDIDPELVSRLDMFARRNASYENINNMNAEQLKELDFFVSQVKLSVTDANKLKANQLHDTVTALGNASMQEIEKIKDRKARNKALTTLDHFINLDQMDSLNYAESLGPTALSVQQALRKGQDKHTLNIRQAMDYMDVLKGSTDTSKWTGSNATVKTFEIRGNKYSFTIGQIMELYELNKREQARGHIYGGGIKIEDITGKDEQSRKKRILKQSKPITVTFKDIDTIINSLTEEQKKIADGMQQFMSNQSSEWGNETSMKMYAYKKFTEKNYYPIKSDDSYTTTNEQSGNTTGQLYTLKNLGMTKATLKNANNPLIISDIYDTFTKHVNEMSAYNAFVVPLSDAMKWYNYKVKLNKTYIGSIKEGIERVWGKAGKNYFINLLSDINGVTKAGYGTEIFSNLIANMKVASVGANVRVVLQQPTAYLRAGYVLDSKYLIMGLSKKPQIEKTYRYAPISQWKAWGFFDTNTGRSMKSIITGEKNAVETIREGSLWLAGQMDNVTWGTLWNACEFEIRAKHPELTYNSDEFNQAVGDRLSEVVDRTQVVDTVFHRSQMMRSKDFLVKTATAFMSEPNKNYNMLRSAIVNATKERSSSAYKNVYRAMMAFASSGVAAAAAAALMDAFRDKDKEKKWLDKYTDALTENVSGNINPLNLLPLAKEIPSIMNGYSPSRMDMTALVNTFYAFNDITKLIKGESKKSNYAILSQTAKAISQVFGIPGGNVLRELESMYNLVSKGGIEMKSDTSSAEMTYKTMYEAIVKGDSRKYNELLSYLVKKGKDTKTIDSGMAAALKENDSRIADAAKEKTNGNLSRYQSIVKELKAQGFKQDTVIIAINSYITAMNKKPEETKEATYSTTDNTKPIYQYKDLLSAIENGNETNILTIRDELVDSGKDLETIQSQVTKVYKDIYLGYIEDGDTKAANQLKTLLISNLGYEDDNFYDWQGGRYKLITDALLDNDFDTVVSMRDTMITDGKEIGDIRAQITRKLKPVYLEYAAAGDAENMAALKQNLMDYFGYESKTIDNWLKVKE